MKWLNWLSRKTEQAQTAAVDTARRVFGLQPLTTREERTPASVLLAARFAELQAIAPKAIGLGAQDSANCEASTANAYAMRGGRLGEATLGFFLNQGFIGFQVCSLLSQHWLIAKACYIPARDAIRKGYEVVSDTGADLPPEMSLMLKKAAKRVDLNKQMQEFVKFGRVFGIRIAFFKVESTNPNYYEFPFNPDGVTPNSYKGIVQVDPYWCSPELGPEAAANPASLHFYEPTFWIINGKRFHRSHLIIFINDEVSDLLKPQYSYAGVSVPQKIVERVYCAERTANEGPLLAMTKRLTVLKTDTAEATQDRDKFDAGILAFTQYRDNTGLKIIDKESEEIEQFDTSLADVDAVIMTEFQLVAAASNVPVTKLLGTTAKGFNATGEGDETNYHEELESIQVNDLEPLLERHLVMVMRSEIMPKLGLSAPVELSVNWNPLDTPTAEELATTNKSKAETDKILVETGALDGGDVRDRIRLDKKSGYDGLSAPVRPDPIDLEEPGDDGLPV